jgi:hypothetical protein
VLPRDVGSGEAVSPATVEQVLALPLNAPIHREHLDPISFPVLLVRLVARKHVSGTLTLQSAKGSIRVPIVAGCPYVRTQERAAIVRAFTWPRVEYSFEPGAPNTAGRDPVAVIELAVEGLKANGRAYTTEEMETALGERFLLAPVLREERRRFLGRLGLDRRELRIVEQMDGSSSAKDLAALGLGRHTVLQLVVLLALFGFLEWHEPARSGVTSLAEQLLERAQFMEKANHFNALGVHWSCTIDEFRTAYDAIMAKTAEGTPQHAECAEACQRIQARAAAAFEVLGAPDSLRAYRAEILPNYDFEALDDLMQKRMRALEMKQDTRELDATRHARQVIATVSGRPSRN